MRRLGLFPLFALVFAACGETTSPEAADGVVATTSSTAGIVAVDNVVDVANRALEARESEYRVAYAEYITNGVPASDNVIFANDRGNKRLSVDFIPDDPRREGPDGNPNNIDFLIDTTQGATSSGLTEPVTTAAIGRAMGTWDEQTCSDLNASIWTVPVDIGLVQAIFGFGGTGLAFSDVTHAGWLPGGFFDLLAPDGSTFILGVTFTLTFTTGDLDGDGAPDLAAREIYYNDAFPWADDGTSNFDVETVALHEAGHGLSQAHFGKIFGNPNSGKLVFSPLAVMNAAYSGVQRSFKGTDDAGHCGLWGNWPQN